MCALICLLLLSLELVLDDGHSRFLALGSYGLCYVDILVSRHLERELYGLVFGEAHTSVRQFFDECRLRLHPRPRHKVERAVGHLLRHASRGSHAPRHIGHRVARSEHEGESVAILGHSAQLHVVAAIVMAVGHRVVGFLSHNQVGVFCEKNILGDSCALYHGISSAKNLQLRVNE